MTEIMTRKHSKWEEFCARLEGEEGCDFKKNEEGRVTWKCGGGNDKSFAIAILKEMGNIDIDASISYFDEHGGYCDCEILFNVVK